jgi:hypothetical protein
MLAELIRKIRSYFKLYIWRDKISRIIFLVSGGLVLTQFIAVLFPGAYLRAEGVTVALRYNIYFGVDMLGSWSKLFFYPLFAFLILMVNQALSLLVVRKDRLIAYYILGLTPALLVLNFLNLLFVLVLNLEFIS